MDIYNSVWNESDASNSTAAPDGAPEGMAPAGINDVLRAHQGAIKRYVNQQIPATTGGSSTAYTLSYSVAPGALVDAMTHLVQFHTACGANPTLNVNALGAKPLYIFEAGSWVQVTAVSTIPTNLISRVAYHSSSGSYRILNPAVAKKSTGTPGYDTMAGGTTRIQWGTLAITGGGASTGVTFPVAFSTLYTVHLTELNDNTKPAYLLTTSSTGFTAVNPGSTTASYNWIAIGAV